jgi:hypothetical protein
MWGVNMNIKTLNIFSLHLILTLLMLLTPLFSPIIVADTTHSCSSHYELVTSKDPLYKFTGLAILLDEEFTPVGVKFKLEKELPWTRYIFTRRDVLEFVKDDKDVYNEMVRILENYEGVTLSGSCSIESSIVVDYNCSYEGKPFICVYYPAGPCWLEEEVPILFEVRGAVYVEHYNGGLRVRVVMNLSIPKTPPHPPYEIEYTPYIERNEYKWIVDMFKNSTYVTAIAEYIIVNNSVYQYGSEVGFSPFYIVYPRNATEIEEVVVKNINIRYYGLPLKFTMWKEIKTIERYGRPPEIRTVSRIVAEALALPQASKLYDISSLTYTMSYYKLPSLDSSSCLTLIIDTLLGKNVTLGRMKSYGYVPSPYRVATYLNPSPMIDYIDHYPIYMRVPVKAKLIDNTQTDTTITLYLRADGSEYTVDPYSIDIGFYEVHRGGDICLHCIVVFLLIIGMVLVGVAVLWRLRRG